MSGLRLAWIHLRVGVLNEMQYRANFFIQLVQSTVAVATGLIALAVIFDHTTDLNGWSRAELIIVMGVFTLVGGLIGFAIEPNMGRVLSDIHQGTFDFVLTKPADSQLLDAFCGERLAGFKRPRHIEFVAQLPKNPNGKVMRKAVQAPYWAGQERMVN